MSEFLDWLEKGYEKDDIGMPFYSVKELRQAFNAGKQQWISVEDRLPDVNIDVLVYPTYGLPVRYLKESGEWFFDALPVTHWMPLPEPPKQDDTHSAAAAGAAKESESGQP